MLATTGIYGAVSFAVNQRTRDLGIRLALGATRFDIVREVFVSGGRPVVRGLFIGLWLSVALAASLRQNMKGTPLRLDSSDPLLYGGAALLLAAAAVLAMSGPGPPWLEIRPSGSPAVRLSGEQGSRAGRQGYCKTGRVR